MPASAEASEKTFTDEEIQRYATYHWLQTAGNDDNHVKAHVWRTIAGTVSTEIA